MPAQLVSNRDSGSRAGEGVEDAAAWRAERADEELGQLLREGAFVLMAKTASHVTAADASLDDDAIAGVGEHRHGAVSVLLARPVVILAGWSVHAPFLATLLDTNARTGVDTLSVLRAVAHFAAYLIANWLMSHHRVI